jgi:Spy/CpxP family protein refolding chaperone
VSVAKTTILAIFVLVLTFGAGLVAGFCVGRFGPMLHARHPEFAEHMILARLDHHLDLTDAQESKIRDIIHRSHAKMTTEIAATNTEIEAVLTSEQRVKFEKMRMHLGRAHGH